MNILRSITTGSVVQGIPFPGRRTAAAADGQRRGAVFVCAATVYERKTGLFISAGLLNTKRTSNRPTTGSARGASVEILRGIRVEDVQQSDNVGGS